MNDHRVIPIHNATGTGNLEPLLHQIRHGLEHLLNTGEKTVIDLSAMPLADSELETLLEILGSGEVIAELNILGKSIIEETRFSGVWILRHLNEAGENDRIFIEIDSIPSLLCAQAEDIQLGLTKLDQYLTHMPAEN